MDILRVLDEMASVIENSRSMPMSSSVMVNRPQLLALIQEAAALIPNEMREADRILGSREVMLAAARDEADAIIAEATAEQERLVSVHEIYLAAVRAANEVREEAEREAHRMRDEIDDYVDSKLANFEVALARTLDAVTAGREKIAVRQAGDDGSGPGRAIHGQLLPEE